MQGGAQGERGVGIDGGVAFLDELDDSLLVDDDVRAQSPLIRVILNVIALQDTVALEHFAVHVAEQREGEANLLGESGIGGGAVHADAEDLGVRGVNSTGGDSSLDRLKLLGSTLGEGQDVDRKVDVFLAAVVAELHGLPPITEKSEIGRGVAGLESHLGHLRFFHLMRQGCCGSNGG